jgi:hypothetical protein
LGENTLRREKTGGKSETPTLGEWDQPKNSKIPRWTQEITTKGSKELSTELLRWGKNESEGVSFTSGWS